MKRFFPGRVRVGRTQARPSPPSQALLLQSWNATSPLPTNHSSPLGTSGCNCNSLPQPPQNCSCHTEPRGRHSEVSRKSRPRSFASWFGADKNSPRRQTADKYHSRKQGATDGGHCPTRFFDADQGGVTWEDAGSATAPNEGGVRRKLVFPGRAVMKTFRSRAIEPADFIPTVYPTTRNGSPDENREPLAGVKPKIAVKGLQDGGPRRQVLGLLEEGSGGALRRSKSTLELAPGGSQALVENQVWNVSEGGGSGRIKRPGTLKRVASPVAIQSPGGKYLKRLNDGVDTPVLILSAHSHGLPKMRKMSEAGRRQSTGSAEGLLPVLLQLTIGAGSPAQGVFDAPKDSPPIWKRRRVSCPRSIAVPMPPPPIYA